ncbi:MAG: Nramp family divalent metal transporter [Planctomycetaceae bacterium]
MSASMAGGRSAGTVALLPGNVVRTIGPGAILLAGSIGGGEWIVGPMVAVQYGSGILWIATVGIILQVILNLESVRYALYTGEPVLTGILRLSPGPKLWAWFYIFVGVAQLATPGLALGCANVIFAASMHRLPDSQGGDATSLLWISYAVLAAIVLLLLSGKSIERVLERLSWGMIILIFSFLIVVNVLFVPLSVWAQTFRGFMTPSALPENMDIMLLALFAATAGSGGIGNLAISNWVRDKGFGMGAYSGGFGGVLAEGHIELSPTGTVFPTTTENLRRWGTWWRYSLVDQLGLWAVGCFVGMYPEREPRNISRTCRCSRQRIRSWCVSGTVYGGKTLAGLLGALPAQRLLGPLFNTDRQH